MEHTSRVRATRRQLLFFLSIEFVPCYIVALVLILPLFIRFVSIYFAFFSSFFSSLFFVPDED